MQAVSALTERIYSPLDSANNHETETRSPISTSRSYGELWRTGHREMPGPPITDLLYLHVRHNACRDHANRVSAGYPRRVEQALKVNDRYKCRCTAKSWRVVRH
jgi:hypothetical protein